MSIQSSPPQPRVPDGTRVYAVGDVHGQSALLDDLLGLIAADAGRRPAERMVVVFVGDYVDRGAGVRTVLDRLVAGPPPGPLAAAEWITLRGNHEDYLLRFLGDPGVLHPWLANGGTDTLKAYMGEIGVLLDDPEELQRQFYRALPAQHLRFLTSLPLSWTEGDYVFVHAGLRPGVPFDRQDEADLMWIRDDFLYCEADHGHVVVHGHTVVPRPELRPNRIAIDTGAYRTGHLTCLVLEGTERRFLST
ncbi:MAG: metallophosphoesterase [Actinomycetota bacterium]